MTAGEEIDSYLSRIKEYGPYGVCLFLGCLGLAMFELGDGKNSIPGDIMQWAGSLASLLSVACFVLWHFWRWPAWFGDLSKPHRAQAKAKAKAKT